MMNFAANIGKESRFPLGKLVATPGAMAAMQRTGEPPSRFLARHQAGDWGGWSAAPTGRQTRPT
jgi:hypothetical protein